MAKLTWEQILRTQLALRGLQLQETSATSWGTPKLQHPAELFLNSCPTTTWLWLFLNHTLLYVYYATNFNNNTGTKEGIYGFSCTRNYGLFTVTGQWVHLNTFKSILKKNSLFNLSTMSKFWLCIFPVFWPSSPSLDSPILLGYILILLVLYFRYLLFLYFNDNYMIYYLICQI